MAHGSSSKGPLVMDCSQPILHLLRSIFVQYQMWSFRKILIMDVQTAAKVHTL